MKQSALTAGRHPTRLSAIVCAFACLCLSLSATLLLNIPARGERAETASSFRSTQTTPQNRALLTHTDAQTKNPAQRQGRAQRPLTRIAASLGNLNTFAHPHSRSHSLEDNASRFYTALCLSRQ